MKGRIDVHSAHEELSTGGCNATKIIIQHVGLRKRVDLTTSLILLHACDGLVTESYLLAVKM